MRRGSPIWFGKYKLIERIAVGGMAEVFLAVRPGLEGFEKTLAIKRIRPHLTTEEAFVKMFLNEAKLAAHLQHPNVVQIYDLGRINESFYIAMEYISGRDMSRVVPKAEKNGIQFPIEYAMSIGSSALEGLAYAHLKTNDLGDPLHIVHRDITPENIMVGWNGNVKILDFGIAKANTQTDQTKAGEIKGKLSYMSPEQGMGKVLDARSDIFTLGVVLYEWVTGYKLFTGENEMAILKSIIDGRIYPPSYFRDDIPEGIEDILMRALAKNRDDRYQTAQEMQYDVRNWLQTTAGFMPTHTHLSNFMKQIFADEIEKERAALMEAAREKKRKTPPPLPNPTGVRAQLANAKIGEAVGKAKTLDIGQGKGGPELIVVDSSAPQVDSKSYDEQVDQPLAILLTSPEIARLRAAAERNGVADVDEVAEVVERIVEHPRDPLGPIGGGLKGVELVGQAQHPVVHRLLPALLKLLGEDHRDLRREAGLGNLAEPVHDAVVEPGHLAPLIVLRFGSIQAEDHVREAARLQRAQVGAIVRIPRAGGLEVPLL